MNSFLIKFYGFYRSRTYKVLTTFAFSW